MRGLGRTAPDLSQVAPSPPIWVKVSVFRSIHCAMKWQRLPKLRLPSGTLVEVGLCGQPRKQATGGTGGLESFSASSSAPGTSGALQSAGWWKRAIGLRDDRAMMGGVSLASVAEGRIHSPVLPNLPMTRGVHSPFHHRAVPELSSQ